MHPRANQDVVALIEEDGGVVRVDSVDREREDARALPRIRGAEKVNSRFSGERRGDASIDRVLLGLNVVEPDSR